MKGNVFLCDSLQVGLRFVVWLINFLHFGLICRGKQLYGAVASFSSEFLKSTTLPSITYAATEIVLHPVMQLKNEVY